MSIPEIGEHYLAAHGRIDSLVRGLSATEAATPAAACPGWSVADVVAHCTGIVEDALAGRLSGPPDEGQTAVQVARHRGRPIGDVLDIWAQGVAPFAKVIAEAEVAPAMIDILSHEHDIRTALGKPGYRDDPGVALAARFVVEGLDLSPDVIEVVFPDASTARSVTATETGASTARSVTATETGTVTQLRASQFEVLRFRLGRRSPDEIASMDWSSDPTPFLDQLFVFGSRQDSLGE